ncbi:unnamed protein product [Hyaloperonospora brassicae]|uniref:Protein kinase domain-containing protein n=1 Tax=Hyaloperonospora brassicae TaxID=162125 RepID=A0AAV0TV66_HYABA|nr:unnamed protein product [Hyaloperonospora brassicae]
MRRVRLCFLPLVLLLLTLPFPSTPRALVLTSSTSSSSSSSLVPDARPPSPLARPLPTAVVRDPLRPGATVRGYDLLERSALLGVCHHEPPVPRDKKAVVLQQTTAGARAFAWTPAAVCRLIDAPRRPHPLPDGPVLEYAYGVDDVARMFVPAPYRLKHKFDAGAHGEVWRATRRSPETTTADQTFVLKRLFVERDERLVQMGLREAHFGARLRAERHVARFVEYFFRSVDEPTDEPTVRATDSAAGDEAAGGGRPTSELWLVFHDEGLSLRQSLYEPLQVVNGPRGADAGAGVVLQPSPFWHKLRADGRGENALRNILRQLLQAVAALHARGITHRDIKPSNILVSIPPPPSTSGAAAPVEPVVKLADFGSAVDEYTLRHLYDGPQGRSAATAGRGGGGGGPSQAEETREYQPPEVLFSDNGQPYDYAAPEAYDLWSVGVVFLELVLGSPHVFLISPRARAKLDVELDAQRRQSQQTHRRATHSRSRSSSSNADGDGDDDDAPDGPRWRTKAYLLHVLTHEFCIFRPAPQQLRSLWDTYALVSESCHFGRFNQTVVARDPLKKGLDDVYGLDLMWKLLQWHPSERIAAADALQHAYFHGPYVCPESGRAFATQQELTLHERYLDAQRARESVLASVVRPKHELPDRFACPHCGRVFATAQSCGQHVRARRHDRTGSSFCAFDDVAIVSAIQSESRPEDAQHRAAQDRPAVGTAVFQGRRKYMEDGVLVRSEQQLNDEVCVHETNATTGPAAAAVGFDLYAVVDGHLGTAAATFVVANLPRVLCRHFAAIANASTAAHDTNRSAARELAEKFALRQTFLELHDSFLDSLSAVSSGTGSAEADRNATSAIAGDGFSGCTLTLVLHFRRERRVVSANVGDSRAVAWLPDTTSWPHDNGPHDSGHLVPLSMDHWPNDPRERARIESSGGFVTFAGLWRVVGQLAVSRSLGDRHLRQFVTAEPSVFHAPLGNGTGRGYLLIASDGLWETMSADDVVRFLQERHTSTLRDNNVNTTLDSAALQDLAARLLAEGYVRGSLDNMALVLVPLPS